MVGSTKSSILYSGESRRVAFPPRSKEMGLPSSRIFIVSKTDSRTIVKSEGGLTLTRAISAK